MYKLVKNESEKEIEYFFNKRFIRDEIWFERYQRILISVFTVNLLAREFERKLKQKGSFWDSAFSDTALSTYFALKEFNRNRKLFLMKFNKNIFLQELVEKISANMKVYLKNRQLTPDISGFVNTNTPIGIELEFSNVGKKAGYFFETGKNDPLLNFSKYNFYHLTKFMWRFGAYIDSNTSFQQFIKKGGFLEYTFTVPDDIFKPSMPLTKSPDFAASLIKEAVGFTPINPHSLHVTLQINDQKLPYITFNDILYLLMVTGHFVKEGERVTETRVTEGNMKDIAYLRIRKNSSGIVNTVEFTNMRLCRDFVKNDVYRPSILLMIAYKNLFKFHDIVPFFRDIVNWGKKPIFNNYKLTEFLNTVRLGLDREVSLPEQYKDMSISLIKELFLKNVSLLKNS